MTLFIKDDAKTEAVSPALERASCGPGLKQAYVDCAVAWSKAFNARAGQSSIIHDEKAFLDSLYED